jgi:hypothetical protein
MNVRIVDPTGLFLTAREVLLERAEQVGFFLASFDQSKRIFELRDWRPVDADGFELRTDYHVTLSEQTQQDVIQWAWQANLCLVEAHSHGSFELAEFSASDMYGFGVWVPHLFWRLTRRPYGALVLAGHSIDGLCWLDNPNTPEQIQMLESGDVTLSMTEATLKRRLNGGGHDE